MTGVSRDGEPVSGPYRRAVCSTKLLEHRSVVHIEHKQATVVGASRRHRSDVREGDDPLLRSLAPSSASPRARRAAYPALRANSGPTRPPIPPAHCSIGDGPWPADRPSVALLLPLECLRSRSTLVYFSLSLWGIWSRFSRLTCLTASTARKRTASKCFCTPQIHSCRPLIPIPSLLTHMLVHGLLLTLTLALRSRVAFLA